MTPSGGSGERSRAVADSFIISKEVDAVLRESVENQLLYFTKRPKLDLSPLDDIEPALVEVAQRRILIIYNGGRVNKTYLAKVRTDSDVKESDELAVDDAYLNTAIDLVQAVGAVLVQLCWRKWDQHECEAPDSWAV